MKAKQLVLAALFCALMVVGAYLHIPMPVIGSITLQTLFCFLCALLLPPSSALLAMGAYLLFQILPFPLMQRCLTTPFPSWKPFHIGQ